MGRHIPILIVLLFLTILSSFAWGGFSSKKKPTEQWGFDDPSGFIKSEPSKWRISESVQMLYSGNEIEKSDAARILISHGDKVYEEMKKASQHDDAHVREWALYIISSLGVRNPELGNILIDALSDEAMPVRYEAGRGLQKTYQLPPNATDEIIKTLSDEDWRVREIASKSLVRFQRMDPKYLPELLKAYDTDRCFIKANIAATIGWMNPPPNEALPMIIQDLGNQNLRLSRNVASAIYKMEITSEEIPGIMDLLADGLRDRTVAPDNLFHVDNRDAITKILKIAVNSHDLRIWEKTSNVLSGGFESGLLTQYPLIRVLYTQDPEERQNCLDFITWLGPSAYKMLEKLEELLADPYYAESHAGIRIAIDAIQQPGEVS